jgi:hypothetical protein
MKGYVRVTVYCLSLTAFAIIVTGAVMMSRLFWHASGVEGARGQSRTFADFDSNARTNCREIHAAEALVLTDGRDVAALGPMASQQLR